MTELLAPHTGEQGVHAACHPAISSVEDHHGSVPTSPVLCAEGKDRPARERAHIRCRGAARSGLGIIGRSAAAGSTGYGAQRLASGAIGREYRDYRLEWMMKSGDLPIVLDGLAKDNMRFTSTL